MTKRTNNLGPGKVNMSTTVPKWLDDEIKELAERTGISRNKYVLALMEDAAKRHLEIQEFQETSYIIKPPKK